MTTPRVPMKYDIQQPSPASPATTEIFSAGVRVGAIAARDWPTVSIRFTAPDRNWERGLWFTISSAALIKSLRRNSSVTFLTRQRVELQRFCCARIDSDDYHRCGSLRKAPRPPLTMVGGRCQPRFF